MTNISTIIILYNSKLTESNTLNSILQTHLNNIQLTVNIWNNGPNILEKADIDAFLLKANLNNIKVEIYQDVRNIALSKIYNYFLAKEGFDFFTLFDQDTIIGCDFFETLQTHQDLHLILPLCYLKEKTDQLKYPIYKDGDKITHIESEGVVDAHRAVSIASGLTISQSLVNLLKQHQQIIFDENLAFYAIDAMFFLYCLHPLAKQTPIKVGCFGKIIHSLSEYEEESPEVKYRRRIEMLYFDVVYKLNYKHKSRLSVLIRIMKKALKGEIKGSATLWRFIKCIYTGQHPRAELNIDPKIIKIH